MSEEERVGGQENGEPKWQPLSRTDRRVAGVLVEKAKTTPSAYPMTVNAITNACNQKSNRFPTMQLTSEEVEDSLDRLRRLGAVGQIEGYGRVDKYRHYLYDWLGVDKVELSVMAELLLRGPQTVGELRGRAARMDPIADVAALQPILESLKSKGLVISLSAEGRGHVVSHALFTPAEMEKVREEFGSGGRQPIPDRPEHHFDRPAAPAAHIAHAAPPAPAAPRGGAMVDLASQLDELRSEVAQLRADLSELTASQQDMAETVRRLQEDLGV